MRIDECFLKVVLNRSNRTQKKQKTKWGYEIYVLSGKDIIMYHVEVLKGAIPVYPAQQDIRAPSNTVFRLLHQVVIDKWHKLFIDNWYTRIPLVVNL